MSFDLNGKVIAVLGATGAQGGSVAKYLLEDGRAKVRAITRNANSASAKALKEAGAEVVVANIDDVASLEKAFSGAYGVFGVTNFWEHYMGTYRDITDEVKKAEESQKKEVEQGSKIVDAAKKAGVKHFVWSTLWHTDVPEDKTPHFEGKWEIDNYAKKQGIPLTSLYTAMYYENIATFGMLAKNEDGTFTLNCAMPPDSPIPLFAVSETGGWVLSAFANPNKWIGKDIHCLGQFATTKEWAAVLAKATGKEVKTLPVTPEAFLSPEGVRKQAGLELWLNLKNFYDHPPGPKCLYDAELSKSVYPEASDLTAFTAKNAVIRQYLEI